MNKMIAVLTFMVVLLLGIIFVLRFNHMLKVEYANNRDRMINKCKLDSYANYVEDWNETCKIYFEKEGCSLNILNSGSLNERLSKDYDRCVKMYQ